MVDLNGDSLADKVWVNSGGTVMYRPNLNRPGSMKTGDSWFGAAQTITGIDSLGRSSDLRIDVHFEAYPVVAIQVGGGFGFSFGDRYFEDVNGDGRVDFIKPGSAGGQTVYYNALDDNGVPMFIDSSLADQLVDRLEVNLDAFDSSLANAAVDEVDRSAHQHQPAHRHRAALVSPPHGNDPRRGHRRTDRRRRLSRRWRPGDD